jgi:hypothetical protein
VAGRVAGSFPPSIAKRLHVDRSRPPGARDDRRARVHRRHPGRRATELSGSNDMADKRWMGSGGFEPEPDGRACSPRSLRTLRLAGFESPSHHGFVAHRPVRHGVQWARADSNHRPRPCKGRVITT